MRNARQTSNVLRRGIQLLEERLPPGWKLNVELPSLPDVDAVLVVRGPDGSHGRVLVEARTRATAAEVVERRTRLVELRQRDGAEGVLLISGFLTELSRKRLAEAGISYLDLTGNVRMSLGTPGLWILTQGADRDPSPSHRGVRSLRGAKAGRLVRALSDWSPPRRVRELARLAGVDAGYATRVLSFLEEENVVERGEQSEVASVRWRELLELWAKDYGAAATNRPVNCLSPRGLESFLDQLRASMNRYAVTASLAVPLEAMVAPARRATCFVDDADRAINEFALTETDVGSNVLLLEPFDPVVYERPRVRDDLTVVALSQCVVDLFAGTGREPAQADPLLEWMERNEDVWRST